MEKSHHTSSGTFCVQIKMMQQAKRKEHLGMNRTFDNKTKNGALAVPRIKVYH